MASGLGTMQGQTGKSKWHWDAESWGSVQMHLLCLRGAGAVGAASSGGDGASQECGTQRGRGDR